MATISSIRVGCDIGAAGVEGQIASFAQKTLNQAYRGEDYDLVANRLEAATYEAVHRIRTHLQVGVTIRLEKKTGVVHISIHLPIIKNEPSDAGEEAQEEPTPLAEIPEEEEQELPHHRKYWPIQSKNDETPRWGRTPSGTRSWWRRKKK